jgi:alpha-mannosidase
MTVTPGKVDGAKTLCVVSHTHWDREWYLPYQSFRVRLVGLFDQLIELFDSDPEYKHFLLDGHTIPIEDYLEVRPDRADDIERLVRTGKLQIGPWYIIPDEALPGGEAHVRNFLRGHRVAARFGPVMKVGYIPDPFGQIAHMPAILNGFGIHDATMWRGADDSLKTTEFFWRSPDGSEVLAIHKPMGYGVAATLPRNIKALSGRVRSIRDALELLATTPYLLLMNGSDHLPPQPEMASMLRELNAELEGSATAEHVSLPEVFARVRAYMGERAGEWPVHEGEFRSGQRAHLLPGVLSARMWIKQRNQACEDLLAHWAEPFSAWADLLRKQAPQEWKEPLPPTTGHMPFPSSEESIAGLVDRAWRYLLENQPHDSICGCSVDGVHEEMRQRYEWVQQVGEEIVRQSLRAIGALAPGDPLGTIAVFNPTPQPATGFVTATVPWSEERPVVGVESKELTANGKGLVPASVVGEVQRFAIPEGAPPGFDSARAAIGFVARDVPGYGYRVYRLVTGTEAAHQPRAQQAAPLRIENSALAVAADPSDGTLTVVDKRTGRTYAGLNRFVDGGDRGDEYNYCVPETDTVVDRPAAPPRIRVEHPVSLGDSAGAPGVSRLIIESVYRLPARLAGDRASRSSEAVEERITSTVTLTEGVGRVDVHTVVENAARDHRLRVHFPSGIRTSVSKADQHFGVIERPIALPAWDPATWMEQPLGTYPQKAFVSVDGVAADEQAANGEGRIFGLTIANSGLPEYEVLGGDAQPGAAVIHGAEIAVTLLRCVGWLSRSDISSRRGGAGPQLPTPGAQMPGRWTFDYSIIPHAGDWASDKAGLPAHVAAVQHLRPMRARWNRHGLGQIAAEGSLVLVSSPAFAVSAIKRAEDGDGIIVRVYNTLNAEAETTVDVPLAAGAVCRVNLNEEHLGDCERGADGVRVRARRNEIVTLRFGR